MSCYFVLPVRTGILILVTCCTYCCFVMLYMYCYFVLPVAATAEQLVVKGQNHGAVDPTVHGGWTERLRDNNRAG